MFTGGKPTSMKCLSEGRRKSDLRDGLSDVVGVSKADRSSFEPPAERSVNRARRPVRKKTARANMPPVVQEQRFVAPAEFMTPDALRLASMTTLTRSDLASGRGLTYEWEFFVDQIFQQLADAGLGPQTFVFNQSSAAAQWTVSHGLTAYPTVLLVDDGGQEMHAEVHYPDDQTVVIIHGQPYSGTAYLRI